MILHHYTKSPFAEKIRLMLGYSNTPWFSAISPPMPPRPMVDPLVGGYRRIPIGQVGADFFCDTRIISAEIAELCAKPQLSFEGVSNEAKEFTLDSNSRVFMAVAQTVSPLKSLGGLLKQYSVLQVLKFIKDRADMAKSAAATGDDKADAPLLLSEFKQSMEARLGESTFLFSDEPSIADFAAYHTVWFADSTRKTPFFEGYPKSKNWQARMASFSAPAENELSESEVFNQARDNAPRPVASDMLNDKNIGKTVTVWPSDYAKDSVTGTLVGLNENRCIVQRETDDFGELNIHFPRENYELSIVVNQ